MPTQMMPQTLFCVGARHDGSVVYQKSRMARTHPTTQATLACGALRPGGERTLPGSIACSSCKNRLIIKLMFQERKKTKQSPRKLLYYQYNKEHTKDKTFG